MTHLRKMMLDELQRRNYAHTTAEAYIRALRNFAAYYRVPPDRLGPKQIREYQLYLLQKRKLSPKTVRQHMAAIKFFFEHTLKRYFHWEQIPYPKIPKRLPTVLSPDEVRQLIDAASNLFHRAILMTLYSTGMRRAELMHLRIDDIDSQRMVIRIHQGKGRRIAMCRSVRSCWKRCANTGAGRNLRPISSRAITRSEKDSASQGRESLRSVELVHKGPVSRKRSGLIHSDIPLPRTSWIPGLTCAPSSCCWDMPVWSTRSSTCSCPSVICTLVPIRSMDWMFAI